MTDTTLPDPLVPAEVDLTDFAFMPLDVQRLRNSELASDETPEACWAAVLLWCAAWHQVPAASIPDNDQWQAKQAGYVSRGRIDPAWPRVREGALRNFVMCSDGRLYHKTMAEKALESWDSKLRHAYGKMLDRLRKANKARGDQRLEPIPTPTFEAWNSGGRTDPLPAESNQPSGGNPPEKPLKGIEGTGKGQGTKEETSNLSVAPARPSADAPPQLSLVEPPPPKPKTPPSCPHVEILALWQQLLPAMPQHIPSQWKGTRADHLRARWRETAVDEGWADQDAGLTYFRRLFVYVGRSQFLTGQVKPQPGKPPFQIELEWLVQPGRWARVIEGKYHQETA